MIACQESYPLTRRSAEKSEEKSDLLNDIGI